MLRFFDADKDYGTPVAEIAGAKDDADVVSLSIDGRQVQVPAGTSIMRAAGQLDIDIPKLCATDSLQAFGSCRLCVVKIEGRKGVSAACTTPVKGGLVVHTQTENVTRLRRTLREL